jgi:hypothetical protein
VPDDSAYAQGLISQLEEQKFLRLFRHLIDDEESLPTRALDLPNTELHLKLWPGSRYRNHTIALYQIAHIPPYLWHPGSADIFLENEFRRAFTSLRGNDELLTGLIVDLEDRVRETHSWLHPYPTERYTHYFFTNARHDISDDGQARFSEIAHTLFAEIVNQPREQHPRFGIGTPQTIGKDPLKLQGFLLDLINAPSSYYLIAREGRISVVPNTEHGSFVVSATDHESSHPPIELLTTATTTLSTDATPGISELEYLINHPRTREEDLQEFIQLHPHFLFGIDQRYCEVRPHVCLYDGRGERLVPDFMARIEDSDVWHLIELKRPQHSLCVKAEGLEKASAAAARGIAQLLQGVDYFSSRQNRERVRNRFQAAPYEPCLVLVIGRGRSRERLQWRSERAGFPKVEIVTYDYLFEKAKPWGHLVRSES